MLFNYLVLLVVVLLPFEFAYLVVWSVKQARKPSEKVSLPSLPKAKKNAKLSKKEQRTIAIMENIDNYDGTSFGQKEIK